jgi:hypothetical protein
MVNEVSNVRCDYQHTRGRSVVIYMLTAININHYHHPGMMIHHMAAANYLIIEMTTDTTAGIPYWTSQCFLSFAEQ